MHTNFVHVYMEWHSYIWTEWIHVSFMLSWRLHCSLSLQILGLVLLVCVSHARVCIVLLYKSTIKVQFVLLIDILEWMDCKAAFLHSLQALLLFIITVIQKSVTRLKLNRSNKQWSWFTINVVLETEPLELQWYSLFTLSYTHMHYYIRHLYSKVLVTNATI